MGSRLELQTELEQILGSRNVYFQPPATIKIAYPAIVYSINNIETLHADDVIYKKMNNYSVTLIDKNPDSIFINKLFAMKYCRFERSYAADNLNHFVFNLFY